MAKIRIRYNIFAGFLFVVLPFFSSPAWSEDKEEYKEQVYLTKKQALEVAFPGAETVDTEKKWLTDADRKAIGELCQQMVEDPRMNFYIGRKSGKPMGYMVMDHVVGKSLPISFMVVLNTDGTVRDVEIMVYREPQGWEIRYESFLKQFFGKNSSFDSREINSITGATLSVRSITRGVSKILAAYKVLYLDKQN